jgi:prepilin-type N-terminal cleavage/methylation domain-containing protein
MMCAARRRAGRDESGFSLIEVVVAMSIMAIFMAMMTTGIIQVYQTVNRHDALATVATQVNVAFLRLDREIRYASDISTPAQVGSYWYVEYLTTNSDTPSCTELRLDLDRGLLQRQSWPKSGTPTGAWSVLASRVGPPPATDSQPLPFNLLRVSGTFNYPRLQLSLVATAGTGSTTATKQMAVTFTAVNALSTTASTCTAGRTA